MIGELTLKASDGLKQMISDIIQESLKTYLPQLETSQTDEFLTRKEAYQFLKIGSTKFNELRTDGIVTPIRIGRKTIYKKSDLLQVMKQVSNQSFSFNTKSTK